MTSSNEIKCAISCKICGKQRHTGRLCIDHLREYKREYAKKPKQKEWRRQYQRDYYKEYRKTPKQKEWRRKYKKKRYSLEKNMWQNKSKKEQLDAMMIFVKKELEKNNRVNSADTCDQ